MKGEFYIGLLTLLLLLAGCDKVDAGRGENDGEVWPVSFMLAGVTPTRADGATGVADGTELTIAAYDPNSHNLVAARNYKVASGSLTLDETDSEAMYLSVAAAGVDGYWQRRQTRAYTAGGGRLGVCHPGAGRGCCDYCNPTE